VIARLAVVTVVAALVAGCAGGSPGAPTATPSATAAPTFQPAGAPGTSSALGTSSIPGASPPVVGIPAFRHVYEIVVENKGYGDLVGDPAAPYFNALLARYASLENMYAETHPSEPNYIALFSGATQGVTDDGVHDLPGTNLVDQLAAHGRTWRVYAENVPSGCFSGDSASGGPDGSGTYARKHEPAISFTDISGVPSRCSNIVDLSRFDPAAADFELIIPNLCHDMHDCSVAAGDAFLAGFVPRIVDSPAFAGSVLFITVDEGTSDDHGGGHIATLVISPLVRRGALDTAFRTHYSLLRTIEDAWGLGCLGGACGATGLGSLFGG